MRYHLRTLLIVLAVAGTSFCTSADTFADEWQPWPNQLFPSANGKYYVVVDTTGGAIVEGEWGPVEFEIAKVGMGNAPAKAVTGKVTDLSGREDAEGHTYPLGTYRITSRVAVREGDHILGRGKLDRPPLCVLVSSSGLGFVGLDVYGYNYAYDEEGWKKATAAILINAGGNSS